jgi:hypothetical protein
MEENAKGNAMTQDILSYKNKIQPPSTRRWNAVSIYYKNSKSIVLLEQQTGDHTNRILINRLSNVGRQFAC